MIRDECTRKLFLSFDSLILHFLMYVIVVADINIIILSDKNDE